jgi:hypothetical protein
MISDLLDQLHPMAKIPLKRHKKIIDDIVFCFNESLNSLLSKIETNIKANKYNKQ